MNHCILRVDKILGRFPLNFEEIEMELVEEIVAMQEELALWRKDIHAHPELGFEENRTADFVAQKLEEFGIQVNRGLGKT